MLTVVREYLIKLVKSAARVKVRKQLPSTVADNLIQHYLHVISCMKFSDWKVLVTSLTKKFI